MGTNTLTRLEIELEQNKDPGIPNNFPYKDRILAEIAEQRRRVRLFSSTPFFISHEFSYFLPLGYVGG